ncbi:MAG: hypothetical protein JWP95_1175 [Actinotalea sp.]|nr:hypothetical protein [Actinotalea sp.]
MRIVHLYSRYLDHPSGVTESINSWVRMAGAEHDVLIACAPGRPATRDGHILKEHTRQIGHLGKSRTTFVPIGLRKILDGADLLYLHEGWTLSNLYAARIARRAGVPFVVMPHGVYENGVVDATRDVFGLRRIAEGWILRQASLAHVFYPAESKLVNEMAGATRPFVAIPNGAPDPGTVTQWAGGGDYFLWIGRFDPGHKGIDNLLRFWARLPEPRPKLVLAGPDFQGGRAAMIQLRDELGLTGSVEIRSHVSGSEKEKLIEDCRGYVHPSRWESCSIALLEMLAAGVPTAVSSSIHAAAIFDDLGVAIPVDFEDGDGQSTIARLDRNRDLGQRAREWAHAAGSWNALAPTYRNWLDSLDFQEEKS